MTPQAPTDIIIEVRSKTRQVDGAAMLSLYLYPRLDPTLSSIGLGEALWWIPRMNNKRITDIFRHIGVPFAITLGALTEIERASLASYLDDMSVYSRQNRGHAVA